MNGKAVTINGHLVKLSEKGIFFRLDGNGVWVQISNTDLFKLISN